MVTTMKENGFMEKKKVLAFLNQNQGIFMKGIIKMTKEMDMANITGQKQTLFLKECLKMEKFYILKVNSFKEG